jgi:mycothione reductase
LDQVVAQSRRYDVVVLGAGSGNSIVDERFADRRVAIVDQGVGPRGSFGGTCLNVGCIPTKMLVHSADLAESPAHAQALGVGLELRSVDWPGIVDRVFGRIDAIADAGRAWRVSGMANVELLEGRARFVGPKRLEVATAEGPVTLEAEQVVVAVGSRPVVPAVLAEAGPAVHTSDTILRLPEVPEHLVVVGTGFVACELAHVFGSLGAAVTVVGRGDRVLRAEDDEVSRRVTEAFDRRFDLRLQRKLVGARAVRGGVELELEGPKGSELVAGNVVLAAVGRVPNADLVEASAGGLALTPDGRIQVDDQQQTNVPGVFALGDVSSPFMLKHVANHEARVVQHNLLHPDRPVRTNHRAVPHAVFTSPRVAAVGLTEREARAAGGPVAVGQQEYAGVAYGWAMEETEGFAKVVANPETGQILGAHVVGPQAPQLLQPLVQAMAFGLDAKSMARGQYWIHPALSEVVENALLALPLDWE